MHSQTQARKIFSNGKILPEDTVEHVKHLIKTLGKRNKQIAIQAGVSVSSVKRIRRKMLNNENTNSQGRPCNSGVTTSLAVLAYIKNLIKHNPTYKLRELRLLLLIGLNVEVSIPQLWKIIRHHLKLRRRHYNHIAKMRASLRIQFWRWGFRQYASTIDPKLLIFVDESHFTFKDFVRKHAWVSPGNIPNMPVQQVSTERYSLLAAMHFTGIIHWTICNTAKETITDEYFANYIKDLLDMTPVETKIVLDNASIHHGPNTKQVVMENEDRFLFTSAYSPDYNAIELYFGYLKAKLKDFYYLSIKLPQALKYLIDTTPTNHFARFILHTIKKYHE